MLPLPITKPLQLAFYSFLFITLLFTKSGSKRGKKGKRKRGGGNSYSNGKRKRKSGGKKLKAITKVVTAGNN